MSEINPELNVANPSTDTSYTFGGGPIDDSVAQIAAYQKFVGEKAINGTMLTQTIKKLVDTGLTCARNI